MFSTGARASARARGASKRRHERIRREYAREFSVNLDEFEKLGELRVEELARMFSTGARASARALGASKRRYERIRREYARECSHSGQTSRHALSPTDLTMLENPRRVVSAQMLSSRCSPVALSPTSSACRTGFPCSMKLPKLEHSRYVTQLVVTTKSNNDSAWPTISAQLASPTTSPRRRDSAARNVRYSKLSGFPIGNPVFDP